jgi:glutamate synthase (NADPH/NADH) small chain
MLVHRRSEAEMPARVEEITRQGRGVEFVMLTAPLEIVANFRKGGLMPCAASGWNLAPRYLGTARRCGGGSEFDLPADVVVNAVGTGPTCSLTPRRRELVLNRGNIVGDENGATSIPGVSQAATSSGAGPR